MTTALPVRSEAEDSLYWHVKVAELPLPEREYRFDPERRWRFDFAWPAHRVAVEVDGGVWTGGRHVRGAGFERDCEKFNAAQLAAWLVLRVTPAMVADGRALKLVERALEVQET